MAYLQFWLHSILKRLVEGYRVGWHRIARSFHYDEI